MFQPLDPPRTARPDRRRRGAILIVVLALLALFAVIGLAFVFYADSEASLARLYKDAQNDNGVGLPNAPPAMPKPYASQAIDTFLGSWIYDVGDTSPTTTPPPTGFLPGTPGTGIDVSVNLLNPLRGHSLAATMYGRLVTNTTPITPMTGLYNGVGTFHENTNLSPLGTGGLTDRAQIVNYTSMPVNGANILLDPEWTGGLRSGGAAGTAPTLSSPGTRTWIAKNAPYTYPDLNNFWLASISPASGEVLVPSFYRSWLFNSNNVNPVTGLPNVNFRLAPWNPSDVNPTTMTSKNTDWITADGRAKILRPRPIDQLSQADLQGVGLPYPLPPNPATSLNSTQLQTLYQLISSLIASGTILGYPVPNIDGSYTGDVQNLAGGVGTVKSDSLLLDLGLPTFTASSVTGTGTYKALVSVLIRDLDSGINLNIAGNVKSNLNGTINNASYAGFGPWEMNPNQILQVTAEANEIASGRYGQVVSYLPVARDGTATMPFDRSGVQLNLASQVSWDGVGIPGATAGGGLSTVEIPSFTGTAQGNTAFQVGAGYPLSLGYVPTAWAANTSYTTGQYVQNNELVYLCKTAGKSGAAPGPTGTGNNITDGGVKWSYAGPSLFDDNVTSASKPVNHPTLYNASDWLAPSPNQPLPTTPFTYPLSDLKRLTYRYADTAENYSQTVINRLSALGTQQTQLVGAIGDANPNSYRTNPAHTKRLLFTTFSAGLDQPGVMANYNKIATKTNTLQLLANSIHATQEASLNTSFTTPAGSTISNFTSITNAQNPLGVALGPIDLNRPLADYRNNTSKPLGPTNMGNVNQAMTDRQNLARDIFNRLILATGAMASISSSGAVTLPTPNGAGGYTLNSTTITTQEYDALRYLAQIAVNIVDYIDKDDISTAFVWNPVSATDPYNFNGGNDSFSPQSTLTDRVVFGVEKPRLVINEAYGEITNDQSDATLTNPTATPPNGPANVRFWVELLNPTATPYAGAGATTSPIGDGSVPLWLTPPGGTIPAYNPYSIIIIRANDGANNVKPNLTNPANVTGDITLPAGLADSGTTLPGGVNYARYAFNFPNGPGATSTIPPNNGTYNTSGTATSGFAVFGPKITTAFAKCEFNPASGGAPWTSMIQDNTKLTPGTFGTMGYTMTLPSSSDLESYTNTSGTTPGGATGLTEHIVVLRRLANPYLPPNDPAMSPDDPLATSGKFPYDNTKPANPFITVDFMDFVPAWDAVHRGGINAATGKADTQDRKAKTATYPVPVQGYDPWGGTSTANLIQKASTGKVQPYAGFAATSATNAPYFPAGFPTSFAISQNPSPTANTPLHTFFRHNGVNTTAPTATTVVAGSTGPPAVSTSLATGGNPDTIMAPFDWFIHPDRPVMDPLEILHARSVKPHELTQYTLQAPTATGQSVQRSMGRIPWFGFNINASPQQPGFDQTTNSTTSQPNNLTHNGLFRALDLIRVKPWGYGEASGGRIAGRLNLNTIQDPRTMLAALDPLTANSNPTNGNLFGAADVNNMWLTYMTGISGRTVNTTSRPLADGSTGQAVGGAGPLMWTSNVPVPGPTVDDYSLALNGGTLPKGVTALDRPFKSFGVAEYIAPTTFNVPTAMSSGSGLQDSFLRVTPNATAWIPSHPYTTVGQQASNGGNVYQVTATGTSGNTGGPTGTGYSINDGGMSGVTWTYVGKPGQPLLWLGSQTNQYLQAELARKLINNTTTVSNTFAVSMTVVFVSVRTSGGTVLTDSNGPLQRPLLGQEAYMNNPGDLRQQFFAVVDRSTMTLVPGTTAIQTQPFTAALSQAPTPVTNAMGTTVSYNLSLAGVVATDATPQVPGPPTSLAVRRDGNTIQIGVNSTLVVGTGSNQDTVTVSAINANGTINVPASSLTHTHYIGEVVTNAVPGYNGPQPAFDGFSNLSSPYKVVVPYAVQIQ